MRRLLSIAFFLTLAAAPPSQAMNPGTPDVPETSAAPETPTASATPSAPKTPTAPETHAAPAGEIIRCRLSSSEIYPGTERDYWIYVPATYRSDKPACLYLDMDCIHYDAPAVFDRMIADGELPVIIGVFMASGAVNDEQGNPVRFNRSNEFDRIDERFADFVERELLPDAERRTTADGRAVRLSKDPNDRLITGGSSGAICAFTAAWQRPDLFSRVFSVVGTYVSMRGGHEYPYLIRKTEPKPLRIFIQDNVHDVWNPLFGHWFEANRLMLSALDFAGYAPNHSWGDTGHDDIGAARIFPEAMRWLWKDWPARVTVGTSQNDMLAAILEPGAEWREIPLSFTPAGQLMSDAAGRLFVSDDRGCVRSVTAEGQTEPFLELPRGEKAAAASTKGIYTTDRKGRIRLYAGSGVSETIARLPGVRTLIPAGPGGELIASTDKEHGSRIVRIGADGTLRTIGGCPEGGERLALFPNHKMLLSSRMYSDWIDNYVVRRGGSLDCRQEWYRLHNIYADHLRPHGNMQCDRQGNLYAATPTGIQVCDHNGRVRAILQPAAGGVASLCFAGADHRTLCVLADGKLLIRRMKAAGATPDMAAAEVAAQGAG
ncbi:alpha/beta hydrolase-fold protein [Alistipes finegoldii]|uniref:alpha/beta hydrolase-fold protein n=1 Tax=Alistipes finegoldii TaxID=214856 RepID=UPI003AF141D9